MAIKFLNTVQVDTDVLYVDAANNRVGIGTTSPGAKLEVVGTTIIDGGTGVSSSGVFHVRQNGDGSSNGITITSSNATSHRIWKGANGTLNIGPSTAVSSFVQTLAGNVGIGTTSPSQKLHVDGNARVTGAYYDSGNTPGTANQLLASTATGTAWIDPSTIVAEAATLVVIACKNTSGAAIAQGTPVYQTGTVGATATIEIAPADALISANKLPAIGLLQTALNNNGFGFVVITGELTNFTTSPIDGVVPTTGDKVFVKSGGGLTLTKPTGEGNGIQNMGLVGKVSTGSAGSITVSSIMRTNDVPNLPEGRIWIGDGNTIVSDTVYVDEPNNRVGIGTVSPGTKLTVDGKIRALGGTSSVDLYSQGNDALIVNNGTANLKFWNNGQERMRINSSGNVGIGTTSPISKLDIRGVLSFPYISTVTGTTVVKFSEATDDEFVLKANLTGFGATGNSMSFGSGVSGWASDIMTWRGDGNVGIGTTGPSQKLQVAGIGEFAGALRITESGTSQNILIGNQDSSGTNTPAMINGVNGNLRFGKGDSWSGEGGTFTEAMRIASTGDVGIGTTSPSEKLDVVGNIELNGALYIGSRGIYQQENTDVSGLELVANASTSLYRAAFFDYVIQKTGNVRAGTVFACNDGGSVEYTETSTNDIGDTSDVVLSVDISGGNMRLLADAATSGWSVKSLIRAI